MFLTTARELLEFVNLRAQASDTSVPEAKKNEGNDKLMSGKPTPSSASCVLYKSGKHPIYALPSLSP